MLKKYEYAKNEGNDDALCGEKRDRLLLGPAVCAIIVAERGEGQR